VDGVINQFELGNVAVMMKLTYSIIAICH